mmetsp:Transcript_21972/g.62580  ORF Transcript_21972/g.62580 Transcript_21972/m.62580 type:complete len:283 (-) Transcript_21972:519-1367(-)
MMPCIGDDHLRLYSFSDVAGDAEEPFLGNDGNPRHEERRRRWHMDQLGGNGACAASAALQLDDGDELLVRVRAHRQAGSQQGECEEQASDGFELSMTVGVIVVGREPRDLHAVESHEVREQVAQGMAGIRDEGGRMARNAHDEFPGTQDEIDEDADEGDLVGRVVVLEDVVQEAPLLAAAVAALVRGHGIDGCCRRMLDEPVLPLLQLEQARLDLRPHLVHACQDGGNDEERSPIRLGQGAIAENGRRPQGAQRGEQKQSRAAPPSASHGSWILEGGRRRGG